jgi:hypothetical protein
MHMLLLPPPSPSSSRTIAWVGFRGRQAGKQASTNCSLGDRQMCKLLCVFLFWKGSGAYD